jgi:hypothetical protein
MSGCGETRRLALRRPHGTIAAIRSDGDRAFGSLRPSIPAADPSFWAPTSAPPRTGLRARPRLSRRAKWAPPIVRCSSEENGMPGTEKFMADLLAIIASTEQSEDQQIDAATKLAVAYTADLKDSPDQWIGKASGDLGLISAHKAIIAEQNRRPAKSPAWRVLHAAENVIGDQKINLRPPARGPARKSRP